MMVEWPMYRITFIEGTVIDIVAAGIGPSMVDAVVAANEQDAAALGGSPLGISDIVEIKQLASVFISPSVSAVNAKHNNPDIYDLTRRSPYDGN